MYSSFFPADLSRKSGGIRKRQERGVARVAFHGSYTGLMWVWT